MRFLVYSCLVLFVSFGVYATCFKDDESLLATRRELKRYALVLEATKLIFPPDSVILSERSDKIFAGTYRVVAPLPTREEVRRLLQDQRYHFMIGLYLRPPSQTERDAWHAQGIELIDVQSFGREHLYRLSLR